MTTFRRLAVEPPLALDRGSGVPLSAQVTGQLRAAVAGNRLHAGERLPPSRALAVSLGVSRTVVTNAYQQLFAEGWLEGRHGSGTYVARGAAARPAGPAAQSGRPAAAPGTQGRRPPEESSAVPPRALTEMSPGIPWVAGIDTAAWRRAWRHAAAVPSAWPDPCGLAELRQALCGYLRRSRGLECSPDHVMITGGVASGLAALAAALMRPGERAGTEEPGYPAGRAILAARGARAVPCPVDTGGLIVDGLPDDLRLIYVTPAHQYPLGGRLPVPRRQALVAWARATGALIVEDDYDSEFRYDVAPLPALYGLDPEVVAYLGTTAKTLTPAFGVGWLVARPDLVRLLAGTREGMGARPAEGAQRALLALIESGDLERHIRRTRREYARRRDAVVSVLGDPAVPATLLGDTAGLHVVLQLRGAIEETVAAAARERGVVVHTLRRYYAGRPTAHGLVLGYGGLALPQVTAAARILRDILVALPG